MMACLPLLVLASALASGDPLVGISIEPEVDVENGSKNDYKRSLYRHWGDYDGDCQKVRHEVLIEESLVPGGFKDKQGTDEDACVVETGLWFHPYNNRTFYRASDVQIDHVRSCEPPKGYSTARDLGPPPAHLAVQANRMNPPGIPVLCCGLRGGCYPRDATPVRRFCRTIPY